MAYKLKEGESIEDAAQAVLGDRRLAHEMRLINGYAYLKDERPGPPAEWRADPSKLRTR